MATNFDSIDPTGTHLDGSVNVTVLDPDQNPNNVLELGRPWSIKVDWEIHGTIATAIGGDWTVKAYLESMGSGFEGQVGPTQVVSLNSVPPSSARNYSTTIQVPANVPPDEMAYKLTVTVTHSTLNVRDRMAGLAEGPLLEFYRAS